jgi:hypothetical protein
MFDDPNTLLTVATAKDPGEGGEAPNPLRVFLWGAVVGAASSVVAGVVSLRDRWKKVKDEGRAEERQKLESEITNQRKEADLRRREAEVRRWEVEDAQSEIQRLSWEVRRAREEHARVLAEREARISALEAELARIRGQGGR